MTTRKTRHKTTSEALKVGRPKKVDADKASENIGFRVTPGERLKLEKKAEADGLSLSKWLRRMVTA